MHPDHKPAFDALADRLHAVLRGRPALFFINPGNWGDALIREGAESFFRAYGIAYRPVRFKDILKKRTTVQAEKAALGLSDPVMIFNGCGAFSAHYDTVHRVAKLARHFDKAIFLPSTYAVDIDTSQFAKETHFFARDRFESTARMPGAPFCHDMAFALNVTAQPPVQKIGLFMRDDVETPKGQPIPEGNDDISKLGRAHYPIDGLLERIGACETIVTNRLHVGIGGALLGRRVDLSANDYFKNEAIFRSSLQGTYPKVAFTPARDHYGQDG